ncbi:unnamed protein product [Onchocerca flexuosa]|uniref:Uncharacterized protein n=1 Tax=Onchocerca flexuosa TaxID=387005 RepID=A0A183H7L9_9BILA|nr:unnamed protein product [Onchocerca flexuosa]
MLMRSTNTRKKYCDAGKKSSIFQTRGQITWKTMQYMLKQMK